MRPTPGIAPAAQDAALPDPVRTAARPHADLGEWYAGRDQRAGFVRELFDATAADYGRLNRLLSFGSGAWHRRRSLRAAGIGPGQRVLDVATGTGLMAAEARRLVGADGVVIGVDASLGMLRQARAVLPIALIQGRAEALPLAAASVDHVTMGYALRHVEDLAATFAEYARVLRPGGRVLLLEFAQPRGRIGRMLASAVLGGALPWLSRLLAGPGGGALMRYCWDTVRTGVGREAILEGLARAGFEEVACEVSLGALVTYRGRRPNAQG